MKNIFCFSFLLLFTITTYSQQLTDRIVLENEDVKVVFNKETGALSELTAKNTQWQFQKRKELGISFQLLVPLPQRRNNPVYGNKQKLKKFELSADKKTILFYWEKLLSEHGGLLNINLIGKVTLDNEGLAFIMQVNNHSPYTVEAVAYPSVGDVSRPDSSEELNCLMVGYSGMDRVSLYPIFPNWSGYFGVNNPTMIVNTVDRFILLGNNKEGFYIGCHDTSMKEMVTYNFELKPGWALAHGMYAGDYPTETEANGKAVHIELNVWHFPFVNPKENISLSPIVLKSLSHL
jgi:hypothetical protein